MLNTEKTMTFKILSRPLPLDVVRVIFEFWVGDPQNDYNFAFNVTRFEFVEAMNYFLRSEPRDTLLLNQMLYASALIPNIQLSLHIMDHGAVDIETAVSLALEHGYMPYIRAILYFKNPHVPLPLSRWVHFLENNHNVN